MGFWSGLARIGGFVAAPFTGGLSIPISQGVAGAIDAAGKGAGAAAQGMASNRGAKASLLLDQNAALEQQLLAREADKRTAQDAAYTNAMRAAIASQWQPATRPSDIPTISFGAGPGDMGRMVAGQQFSNNMGRLLQPDLVNQTGMPEYRNLALDPEFSGTMNSSFWEKLLGGVSAGAGVVSALNQGKK